MSMFIFKFVDRLGLYNTSFVVAATPELATQYVFNGPACDITLFGMTIGDCAPGRIDTSYK